MFPRLLDLLVSLVGLLYVMCGIAIAMHWWIQPAEAHEPLMRMMAIVSALLSGTGLMLADRTNA